MECIIHVKKYIEYVKDMKVYAKNTGGNTSWSINSWKEKSIVELYNRI